MKKYPNPWKVRLYDFAERLAENNEAEELFNIVNEFINYVEEDDCEEVFRSLYFDLWDQFEESED